MLELLANHMGQWACCVAYPELAHIPMLQLRRFAKKTTVARFSSAARALVSALEANLGFVEERRKACDFAPKDTGLVQAFLKEEDASQRVGALMLWWSDLGCKCSGTICFTLLATLPAGGAPTVVLLFQV